MTEDILKEFAEEIWQMLEDHYHAAENSEYKAGIAAAQNLIRDKYLSK